MTDSQKRRPVNLDDLSRLTFIQTTQILPDGRTIVYSISHVNDQDQEVVNLWLLSLETGVARQLTNSHGSDTNPHWSPDGRTIAFLSTRDGQPQIYLIPVDGGEARALTAMDQIIAGGPAWSPDGKMLAYVPFWNRSWKQGPPSLYGLRNTLLGRPSPVRFVFSLLC